MDLIIMRDQVCNVMASLTKTFCQSRYCPAKPWSDHCLQQQNQSVHGDNLVVRRALDSRDGSQRKQSSCVAGSHPGCPLAIQAALGEAPRQVLAVLSFLEHQRREVLHHSQSEGPEETSGLRRLAEPASGSPSPRPKLLYSLLTLFFTHLWWPWWSPWCSFSRKELVTCFFKMTSSTINLRPLDQSQQRSIDHLKRDHFEEPTENSFCFSLLRKVCPSRERPICPQQEIREAPGLLALQAKGYHRFNWEEVTIDVHGWWQGHGTPSLPFKSHKTWGGAWTPIPYIVCACVEG